MGFSALLIAPAALLVPLPTNAWGWLAASWVLHLLYTYALIRSFEQADMSVSYPIARGLAAELGRDCGGDLVSRADQMPMWSPASPASAAACF